MISRLHGASTALQDLVAGLKAPKSELRHTGVILEFARAYMGSVIGFTAYQQWRIKRKKEPKSKCKLGLHRGS